MGMSPNNNNMRHHSILKDPHREGAGGTSSSSANTTSTSIWKKVCWDDCQIREFQYVLGDNPAVSKGAPLQIDWDYHNEDVIDVDIFEHCREPVRRHRKKIVMSARKRAKILLAAGHTVEEIADMTLLCQNAKKDRVESIKNFGNFGDQFTGNLADFMSGTAEVTGRTLKLVGLDSISNAGKNLVLTSGKIVLGTGKMATDVVVGTGKIGRDVVVGTGKVATDVVVGTGKVATDVVVGTGKLGRDVVLGTGNLMVKGTLGTGKTLLGAARRVTGIFTPGDLQRNDLREGKAHLKHVSAVTDPAAAAASNIRSLNSSEHSTRKGRSSTDGKSRRRQTEGPRSPRKSLSPMRDTSYRRQNKDSASKGTRKNTSALRENTSALGGVLTQHDDVVDELAEMEEFMLHLQGLSPDQVKAAMTSS